MPQRVEIEEIGETVLAELYKRLGNPAKAKEIPGTMLLRLAEHYLRYQEREQIRNAEEEVVPITFLEAIEEGLLPLEYQREKLLVYKDWLDNQLKLVRRRLRKIEAQEERDDLAEVP